jgi:MoxR-like ATPase
MNNWHIFTGSHVPHDGLKQLPPPPPWRDYTKKAEQPGKFQSDDRQVEVVNAALYLRRPILVTGSPGSGKSSLAYAVANELKLGEVLRWNINSRSTRDEGLYSYDAIARLRDTNPNAPPSEERIGEYIRLGPLGTAIALSEPKRPRVVLVDEIDKSDIDLPNDLLHVLEDGEFEIPELKRIALRTGPVKVQGADREQPTEVVVTGGKIQGRGFPFVLLTSNGERELPPAFFRRCLRLDLDPPKDENERNKRLRAIVAAHLGALDEAMLTDLLRKFLDKQKTGTLATDQLMNALFLIDRGKLPEGEERKRLEAILLRELGGTDGS